MKIRNVFDSMKVIPTQKNENNEVVRTRPEIQPVYEITDSGLFKLNDNEFNTLDELIADIYKNKAQNDVAIDTLKNELKRVKNICQEYQYTNEDLNEKLYKRFRFPINILVLSFVFFFLSGFFAFISVNNFKNPIISATIYPESLIQQKIEIAVQKERELVMSLYNKGYNNLHINMEDLLRGEAQIKGE